MLNSNKYNNQPELGVISNMSVVPQRNTRGYMPKTFLFGTLVAASSMCMLDGTYTNDYRERVETYIESREHINYNKQIYSEIAKSYNAEARNDQYKKAMNVIREIILSGNALSNNWDGFGALPVGVQSAAMAISLLDFLSPVAIKQIDDCFPESNGTISMKWNNKFSERVSVNIGSTHMSYYVKLEGEETEYFSSIEINEQSGLQLSKKIESVICA